MANVKNNASAKETKRKLIEAAGAVFAEHGFERATIKEITDRAGASLAAVNYHFSDKQELYDQVVQYVHSFGDEPDVVIPADMPPALRLRTQVTHLLRCVLDARRPAWHDQIKAREMQKPSPITERFIQCEIVPYVRDLEAMVRSLVPRELSQAEVTRLVNSVIGQCVFYAHNRELLARLHPDEPSAADSLDAIADHVTRFTMAALSCWR